MNNNDNNISQQHCIEVDEGKHMIQSLGSQFLVKCGVCTDIPVQQYKDHAAICKLSMFGTI